jgi:effector-binding domain-containing protein
MTVVLSEPQVVTRPEQPCLGARTVVTMETMPEEMRRLFDALHERIGRLDVAGPPFARYLVIDMARELHLEIGVPVTAPTGADGEFAPGVLPAGRYLTAVHTGPYDRLEEATGAFLARAAEQGHTFDSRPGPAGDEWSSRLEEYLTDPSQEADPARWETRLAFRLRD